MAALAITGRSVVCSGRFKRETGKFTPSAWNASEWFETKLGRLMWLRLQSVDGTADATLVYGKNVTSGLVSKSGHVLLISGGQTDGSYMYEAAGVG